MRAQLCVALVAIALVCAHVAAQEETAERSVQNVPNQGGGKVTLISNKNTLTHIQQAPKYIDNQAKQEQAEKFATEEKQKKASEEDMKNSKEQDAKKQQATEQAGKKELEEGQKKIIQEAADKKADEEKQKAAEADTKAKDKAAEEKTKADESATKKAAEAKEKDEKQKSDEAAKKKQDEADQKKADEQKEKDDVNLKFNNGWTNYQNTYEVAHCYNWDRYTMVHGLVRGWDGFVGTLGTKCRPSGRLIFTGMRGREARVDVLADGRVYLVTSGDGSDWLSLDNIHFDREIQNGLGLGGGKYPYGGEYRQPSQTNAQGLCAYSGLVAGSQGGYYATCMGGCAPGAYLMFTANNHDNTIGLYMDPSGNTYHHDTGINHGWVALDGLMWSAQVSGWLNLYNGWRNYGGGWRSASYSRIGNICVLGGLMGASFNSHITNLPPGCRPRARLIFPVHNPGRAARVDVTPDGNVYYVSYGTSSWMSLSNIQFVAYN